jgi:membrane-bound lytic murein transglycosylase C
MRLIISIAFSIILLAIPALSISDYEKWQTERDKAINKFTKDNTQKFNKWQLDREEKLKVFKNKMIRKWGSFSEPKNYNWVEYRDGGNSKSVVDFKKGTVTVEVIVKDGDNSQDELAKAIEKTLSSRGSSSSIPIADSSNISNNPILDNIVMDSSGAVITDKASFAKSNSSKYETVKTTSTGKIVKVSFPLVENYIAKKMKPYLSLIDKYSNLYGIDKAQVLATIHTESYFNPVACSQVGAIGLMQLVPTSGGRDAYKFVTGKSGIPSEKYLYNPENNIKLGCAYIKILKDSYFKKIDSGLSKRYCVIAAYNTGAGNVAKTFNGNIGRANGEFSVFKATPIINSLSDIEVYNKMIMQLPYKETRNYLRDVNNRVELYSKK